MHALCFFCCTFKVYREAISHVPGIRAGFLGESINRQHASVMLWHVTSWEFEYRQSHSLPGPGVQVNILALLSGQELYSSLTITANLTNHCDLWAYVHRRGQLGPSPSALSGSVTLHKHQFEMDLQSCTYVLSFLCLMLSIFSTSPSLICSYWVGTGNDQIVRIQT